MSSFFAISHNLILIKGEKETNPGAFSNFRISPETIELLKKRNVTELFPIQYNTFDHVFNGKDVVAKGN